MLIVAVACAVSVSPPPTTDYVNIHRVVEAAFTKTQAATPTSDGPSATSNAISRRARCPTSTRWWAKRPPWKPS